MSKTKEFNHDKIEATMRKYGAKEGAMFKIDTDGVKQYEGTRVVSNVTLLENISGRKKYVLAYVDYLSANCLVPVSELKEIEEKSKRKKMDDGNVEIKKAPKKETVKKVKKSGRPSIRSKAIKWWQGLPEDESNSFLDKNNIKGIATEGEIQVMYLSQLGAKKTGKNKSDKLPKHHGKGASNVKFEAGGNVKTGTPRRHQTLDERAEQLVGSSTWHALDVVEKADVVSELVTDGLIPIAFKNGGRMYKHGGNVMVGELVSSCCSVPAEDRTDEMAQICSKCGEHCTYVVADDDFNEDSWEMHMQLAEAGEYDDDDDEEFEDGGNVLVLEGKSKVSYVVKATKEKVEKEFDTDKAELYYEAMSEDPEVENVKIELLVEPVEKKAKPSLFATAKKAPATTAASKKEKPKVQIDGMADNIARYDELTETIKNSKSEQEIIGGILKQAGKEKFIEIYKKTKAKPDNFDISDEDKKILLIVMDKYKKVEPEKQTILEQSQYDGLLETTTTYSFNPEVLDRIGDVVSRIIVDSKLLSDEDKDNLIIKTETVTIKKGSLDRLLDYSNPEQVFDLIEPILALK